MVLLFLLILPLIANSRTYTPGPESSNEIRRTRLGVLWDTFQSPSDYSFTLESLQGTDQTPVDQSLTVLVLRFGSR